MNYFTVYRTTNKINGKVYIGKHITKNINDGYLGSGKRLRLAFTKYGIDNFQKEILASFDTEEEMNRKEAELVTEEFCLSEKTYNLCVGGRGGFSYINRNGLGLRTGSILSQKQLDALRNSHLGKPLSEETREKIKQNNIRTAESRREKVRLAKSGKTFSLETRRRMSESLKRYWANKKMRS